MPPIDPIEKNLEIAGAGRPKKNEERQPMYSVLGDSKIPVSKVSGKVWESRKNQGLAGRSNAAEAWDEAIRYYDNDQLAHRSGDGSVVAGNRPGTRLGEGWTETENVVFSNCSIMVPMLYAKNPRITVSHENDEQAEKGRVVERLINALIAQKNKPGLNFKPKARRAVLTSILTNRAVMKIGWTQKQDSSEEAMRELQQLSEQLVSAKKKKDVLEVEGKIQALEEKISMLSPSGPWCKALMPHRLVVDPISVEPDLSDANWCMEWDFLPTNYINAVYGKRQGEEIRSIYEPTHVLKSGSEISEVEEQVNTFSIFDKASDAQANGYENPDAYEAACHTKVWYVWDKVTRRVFMYADNKWTWPIWVWDDPCKLPRFFPYFILWFHEAVNSNAPKGEVTYYLDQQDAINEIHSEIRRGRQWSKRNLFFNKNTINQTDVEQVLKGDDGTCRGIDISEGSKIEEHIFPAIPPGLKLHPEFYSTDTKFAAINRVTGINDAMRGAQFKTNTTNKAIDEYQQNVDIRVDERVDLIEDFIGDIMWNIAMFCLMYWEAEDVAPFVGTALAQSWQKIDDPRTFEKDFTLRVEGGSTAKPNSREKRKQALELGQILGQFANAAPAAIIVMLKMFERSFDEFVIEDNEWELIEKTMMQSLQKAGGGPGAQGGQEQPPEAGAPVTNEGMMQQVKQRIAALPPEAQKKLEEMVHAGMPPSEALQKIEAELKPQQ